LPRCPRCGGEVSDEASFCPKCGFSLEGADEGDWPRTGATDHLRFGFQLASEKPMVFAPALLGSLISIVISNFTRFALGIHHQRLWYLWPGAASYPSGSVSLFVFSGLLSLVGFVVSYILFFASIDMSRDAYFDSPLNLSGSVSYVLSRIGLFIVASVVGAFLSITIILIPVVILMFVVMVVDEAGVGHSLPRAFSVVRGELGDVIILLVVSIVGSIILGIVPYISDLLVSALEVIIGLAFIDLYYLYKKKSPTY